MTDDYKPILLEALKRLERGIKVVVDKANATQKPLTRNFFERAEAAIWELNRIYVDLVDLEALERGNEFRRMIESDED